MLALLPPLILVTGTSYGNNDSWLIVGKLLLFFFLLTGMFGLVWGIAFASTRFALQRVSLSAVRSCIFPCIWVCCELVLRTVTFGFDWWFAGVALIEIPILRGIGAIGGAPMLSLYTLVAGGALYFLTTEHLSTIYRSGVKLANIILVSAGLMYGVFVYHNVEKNAVVWPRTAIVQTNTDFPEILPLDRDRIYGPLILKALLGSTDVVIFPGQITRRVIKREEITTQFWQDLLGRSLTDKQVLSVVYFPVEESTGLVYQTMFAVRKRKIEGEYKKEILFPVSDYMPSGFLTIIFTDAREYILQPYTADQFSSNGILTKDGIMGGLICNEAFTSRIVSRIVRQNVGIVVQSGSDKPFLSDDIFTGTLRMAQLRALQANVWWLRANKTGISAIISPRGDVLSSIDRNKRGILYFSL